MHGIRLGDGKTTWNAAKRDEDDVGVAVRRPPLLPNPLGGSSLILERENRYRFSQSRIYNREIVRAQHDPPYFSRQILCTRWQKRRNSFLFSKKNLFNSKFLDNDFRQC